MRIGCTSYCIPGTYGENIRFIAGDKRFDPVSHIQLLCYFWDDEVRELLVREREVITGHRSRFTYSVHLPDRIIPEHEQIIQETRGYCLHYDLHPQEGEDDRILGSLIPLAVAAGGMDRFFLENLIGRDMEATVQVLGRINFLMTGSGISHTPYRCVDTGHLLMTGFDPAEYCSGLGDAVRQIHLHGVRNGADHHAFGPEESWFKRLVPFLAGFKGMVILEVFTLEETVEILEVLRLHGLVSER